MHDPTEPLSRPPTDALQQPSRSPDGMRLGLAIAGALLVGVATALAGDRIVRHFALHHHPMTPQLSLAAAMGGLFAGGLAMLGTLLLTIPWAGRQPRVPR